MRTLTRGPHSVRNKGRELTVLLGICVSCVGEHISLVIMCFPSRGTHITRDLGFLRRGTHITYYIDCKASNHLNLNKVSVYSRGILQIKATTFD